MALHETDIWNRIRDPEAPAFIVAEIGKNQLQTADERLVDEYLENAKALVHAARDAGADAVKFQTHILEDEQHPEHAVKGPHFDMDRRAWVERNERATPLNRFWIPIKDLCDALGLVFFSTPMSRKAAELLREKVGVPLWKIASSDILDFVMLDYIRATGLPVIISSGMSTIGEVERALNFLHARNERVALLHCVSKYPCPPEELRLGTMRFLREHLPSTPVGFSDHSTDIDPPVVAVAFRARIIEKHFSLSRHFAGSDHKVSLEPAEFAEMVRKIRRVENDRGFRALVRRSDFAVRSLAQSDKVVQDSEVRFRPVFRKGLVAARDIATEETLSPEMIFSIRPFGQLPIDTLPSDRYEKLLGRTMRRPLKKYESFIDADLVS